LLDANTPEIFVAQLSGHKYLQSLQSYKSGDEQHQLQMSSVLSGTSTQNQPRRALNPLENLQPTILRIREPIHVSRSETQLYREDSNSQAVLAGASISSISECQFQIFNGQVKIRQENKRRRIMIESDEED
jgi:hypothetical protein